METHSFTAAVRGFHYYRRFWRPKENEKLDCLHEPGNAFDHFAIKTVNEKGENVGHLPKEISRVTFWTVVSLCIVNYLHDITVVHP